MPIVEPTPQTRSRIEPAAQRLVEIAASHRETRQQLLDWLKVEHDIPAPSTKLQNALYLDSDALVAEVRKVRGTKKPLSLAALRNLRDEHARTIIPTQLMAREALDLKQRVSSLVNAAYGLAPEEVSLTRETAPPRMPIAEPPKTT
jgi:hypothetical protein